MVDHPEVMIMVHYETGRPQMVFPGQVHRVIPELTVQPTKISEVQGLLQIMVTRAENPGLLHRRGHTQDLRRETILQAIPNPDLQQARIITGKAIRVVQIKARFHPG